MERLLRFLREPFGGGTDLEAPFVKALKRLQQDQWKRADILLVTDGDFAVSSTLAGRVQAAKRNQSLRCHGLIVGGYDDSAIRRLCDPVHHYKDWCWA
jgi:uncharacterized protein with von Willebrand factor type A (vWA) domain